MDESYFVADDSETHFRESVSASIDVINHTLSSIATNSLAADNKLRTQSNTLSEIQRTNKEMLAVMKAILNALSEKRAGARDGPRSMGQRTKKAINKWCEDNSVYVHVPKGSDAKKYYLDKAKQFIESNLGFRGLEESDVKDQIVSHKSAIKKRARKQPEGSSSDDSEGSSSDGHEDSSSDDSEVTPQATPQATPPATPQEAQQEAQQETPAAAAASSSAASSSTAGSRRSSKRRRQDPEEEEEESRQDPDEKEAEKLQFDEICEQIQEICGRDAVKATLAKRTRALGLLQNVQWTHLKDEVKELVITLTIPEVLQQAQQNEKNRPKGKRSAKGSVEKLAKLNKKVLQGITEILGIGANMRSSNTQLAQEIMSVLTPENV